MDILDFSTKRKEVRVVILHVCIFDSCSCVYSHRLGISAPGLFHSSVSRDTWGTSAKGAVAVDRTGLALSHASVPKDQT